ncbi:uncharacterized protein BXZ73DRAFT_38037 [Epithele typhae]|uniref:uncharacterized protein n=1 Tax=Epithele typhae TaxID=378194 RepID=UPI002007626B|nr:uncharacterized protein BXZ73DRAFT_38037 [Epithele typhae]KAH9945375.1 hypothetical protein BXZ73DRAFT_38037 [Epithele typhae]
MVFLKSQLALGALTVLAVTESAYARMRWLERDGRHVALYPRRFGEEHPAVIDKISSACPGQVCGTLAGAAITPLLAAQGECTQQDMADQIIDAAQQFDEPTKSNMIALAVEYRQAEKNTPPDFSVQPNILRNSVFCQKAPKNSQLNGLVQAQDPANDPNAFFDPALSKTVQKGSQANTSPFGGAAASSAASAPATSNVAAAPAASTGAASSTVDCEGSSVAAQPAASTGAATTIAASPAASTGAAGAIGNFGKCSVPQIEFGVGFDNRKETSFQPVDKTSFNHGSAQAIGIITQFICDTLTNSCGADATAKATCAKAQAAAAAQPPKTGVDADAFNAVFGIKTNFAAVNVVSDQGVTLSPQGSSVAAQPAASTSVAASPAASTGAAAGGIGNFGKCSVPQIEFGVGFDNRKETSFQPVDKASFNHGSAQAIGIITQFICDTLTNSCGADATAKATCAKAQAAAAAQPPKTGVDADAFNAVFGIKTNFAAVSAVSDQGVTLSPQGSSVAAQPAATTAAATKTTASAAATSAAASTGGNLQKFTGALGNVTPPPVTANGDGSFQVTGNASFKTLSNALVRSCDVQHNQCANAANASGNKGALTVEACGTQQTQCNAAQ